MVIPSSYSYLMINTCKIKLLEYLALPNLSSKSAILGRGKTTNLEFALSALKSIHILDYHVSTYTQIFTYT